MKVYIRNDLNMRKGKVAAQTGHAVTGVLLGAMDKTENEFILSGENLRIYKEWKSKGYPVDVQLVNSEDYLLKHNKENNVLIKDQGRTEFSEPTNTCIGELEGVEIKERINLEYNQDKPAKQILIANRDLKLTKWQLAPKAGIASWLVLEEKMIKNENEWILKLEESAVRSWLLGAFAKITLKIEEINIENLVNDLSNNNIDFYEIKDEERLVILATSPQHFEDIDPYTSNLKLY